MILGQLGNGVTHPPEAPTESTASYPVHRRARTNAVTWTPVQARLAVRLAEQALSAGEALPSVRALRERLGGGSMRDLAAGLRAAAVLLRETRSPPPLSASTKGTARARLSAHTTTRAGVATATATAEDDSALRRAAIDAIMAHAGIASFRWSAADPATATPPAPDVTTEQVVMAVGEVALLNERVAKAESRAIEAQEQAEGLRRHLLLETARLRDELRARFGTVRSTVIEEPLAPEPVFERR